MQKLLAVLLATSFTSGFAMAGDSPQCELQPDVVWMEQAEFEEKVQGMGYTIDQLAVSSGNCYQMMGQNKAGEGVMVFFNPQTGDVVQEDLVQ